MTEVVIEKAKLRRPYNFDTLTDIVPNEKPRLSKAITGDLVVTFDADLTAEQVAAIRLRLVTANDAEAEKVVALTRVADEARAWVPPALRAAVQSSARLGKAQADAIVAPATDAERDAAIVALSGQVEALSQAFADLAQFVLER